MTKNKPASLHASNVSKGKLTPSILPFLLGKGLCGMSFTAELSQVQGTVKSLMGYSKVLKNFFPLYAYNVFMDTCS